MSSLSPSRGAALRPTLLRTPSTALENGHEYAARAERLELSSEYGRAAEMAKLASESYARAVEETNVTDSNVKTTMVKLQEDWLRRSKDLQRKHDYAQRQPARSASTSRQSSVSAPGSHSRHSSTPSKADSDPRAKARANGLDRLESAMAGSIGDSAAGQGTAHQSPPLSADGNIPPGESFMMLADQDPTEPFNQFWTIMQGLLDNLSGPVAWATVPLHGEAAPSSTATSSTAAATHPVDKQVSGAKGKAAAAQEQLDEDSESFSDADADDDFYIVLPASPSHSHSRSPKPTKSHPQPPPQGKRKHSYPPARGKTPEELHYENLSLKSALDTVTQQLAQATHELEQKKAAERANLLKLQGSWAGVKQRMHTSVMGGAVGVGVTVASPMMGERELRPSEEGRASPRLPGRAVLALAPGGEPGGLAKAAEETEKEREIQKEKERQKEKAKEEEEQAKERKREEETSALQKKLQEAEDEAARLRAENEKHIADIKRYRERWEKLKESAKKKREAKAAAAGEVEEEAQKA